MGALIVFNGVLAGIGGVYASTRSAALTTVAAGLASFVAALYLVISHKVRRRPVHHDDAHAVPFGHSGPGIDLDAENEEGRELVRDHEVFEDFFRSSFPPLVGLLIKAGASRSEAEDSAGEAMTRAYRDWATIQNPKAWVRVVAMREYVRSRRPTRTGQLVEGPADNSPYVFLDLGSEARTVLNLLRRLPLEQRRVMALHYDGFSLAEIAEMVGRPGDTATVRSNLRHARKRLRQWLAGEGIL